MLVRPVSKQDSDKHISAARDICCCEPIKGCSRVELVPIDTTLALIEKTSYFCQDEIKFRLHELELRSQALS